jgi:uncharacterized repeat protein (TIGR04138 family)
MELEFVEHKIRSELIENGKDTRYKPGAYLFILSGLSWRLSRIGEIRHVSGGELSISLLHYAAEEFGPLARSVLAGWGIDTTADFGNIVYNLIDIEIMGREPRDRIEDFFGVADLDRFFAKRDYFKIDKNFIRSTQDA